MNLIIAIAAGGALGAVLRHGVNLGAAGLLSAGFPWGTLIVNIVGSFLMGIFIAIFAHMGSPSQELRHFIIVGVLGAMTTFSNFSLDAITLFERGDVAGMGAYMFGSVFCSIMALFTGLYLVRVLMA